MNEASFCVKNTDKIVQKSKDYIDELLNMSDPSDTSNPPSEVAQYYTGRNVLITGSSGFFGILLIERLLRCCPGLGKMYLFMKGKKEKSTEERFKEHFDCVIYDRLKKEQPDFLSKVVLVNADFSDINLSLSPENRKRILDTHIIFHMAACVRFKEPLKNMVNITVKGTKEFLLLAREMPDLEAFVYISTAFSNCVNKFIDEKYYPPPIEVDKILTLLDILDDKTLDKITPILLGKWPNTYTYTKAIAEDAVRKYSVGLPTCIVRPSIVTSTEKEPIPGWTNNIYGAVGVVAGASLGLLRTLHCVPENTAEIIPADYVIANIITAAWDIGKRKDTLLSIDNTTKNAPETERTAIYNCVASAQNYINWEDFMKMNRKYGFLVPSTKLIWYYMLTLNRYLFVHNVYVIFLHMIPGAIIDSLAFLIGRKPILLKAYKKIYVFSEVISYFTTHQWQFCNDSVIRLWESLNPTDRQIFNFNVQNICWEDYIKNIIPGLRVYIIKDPLDTLDEGRAKYKKLKIAHFTILYTSLILLIWVIIYLGYFIISLFY